MSACIYVPRMPVAVTDYNIVLTFNNFEIGIVSRVDFTAIGKKPGFVEEPTEPTELNTNFKAAFIHIHEFYSSQLATDVQSALETGECYKLQVSEKSFWMLLKATTPVKETKMNIHQIVDNCRYLEGVVEAQQKQIEAQQKQIEAQQKHIDNLSSQVGRIEGEVYQLFGGLFNQTTQKGTLNFHLEMLGIDTDGRYKEPNTSKWDIWPTTRQGDELEERMDALEKQLASASLEKKVKDIDSCVKQIIGGIYCQKTQNGIIKNHMDVLNGKEFIYDMNGIAITNYPEPTHKHGSYPTTRQGDKLEARVEKLEQMLLEKEAKIDVNQYIEEFKQLINTERAQNSSSLCGNE